MAEKTDRCALAYQYHRQGCSCAQSVLCAFSDLTGLETAQAMTIAGGFGGGVGGSHAELCGAVSGGVLVLSLLFPHADSADTDARRRITALTKTFRERFLAAFGHTRCGELLSARPGVSDKTPAAQRLGITAHCDLMIVTAVELVEGLLREAPFPGPNAQVFSQD